jgi:RHS repeat-associated protein
MTAPDAPRVGGIAGGDDEYTPPALTLPPGGGAIRSIGETVSANNLTGAASINVPIRVSPARSKFTPQVALSYESAVGNGAYGVGWDLSIPAVTRKTDKGLPRYRDDDVFLISAAEDLVGLDEHERDGYRIRRYRPRVEQAFARIERWTRLADGDVHWRSCSKDNVLGIYGDGLASRLADPADPARVYAWLLSLSLDGKGNAIAYQYVPEDRAGVEASSAEHARGEDAGRYLKAVRYGNRVPVFPDGPRDADPGWMFEVRLDYGEEDYEVLPPDELGRARVRYRAGTARAWPAREDPFSSYRAGFELRTRRLCRRFLLLHHFPDELGAADYLVGSTELAYRERRTGSFLTLVTQSGYRQSGPGEYLQKSLPPLELSYSANPLEDPSFDHFELREVDTENLPEGIDAANVFWLDLDGEGIAGALTQDAGVWRYKPNLGDGRFGPSEIVRRIPAIAEPGSPSQQFLDVASDGNLDLVELSSRGAGYHERLATGDWEDFRPFRAWPVRNYGDPNLRFVDLTGDGVADILITEEDALVWHPSLLREGFGPAVRVRVASDEEGGPRVVFDDGTQSIFLADMSGDGMVDLVRVRNGEICYWPNCGYGRFGAKVTMAGAPRFTEVDQFDPRRVRLADVSGYGTTDVLYLGARGVDIYLNESGNSWSGPRHLTQIPTAMTRVTVVDLLGRGTACVVCSSSLPGDARRSLRYVDLTAGRKPHLLVCVRNNVGSETTLEYASSTEFYLADKRTGRPWATRLPFPVHVVRRIEVHDLVSHHRYATMRSYHHGCFDSVEREFRGFGCIEQIDADDITLPAANQDPAWRLAPVLTKSWFHTGVFQHETLVSRHLAHEYFHEPGGGEGDLLLEDTVLPVALGPEAARESCRGLKGSLLRREIYALDGTPEQGLPYSVQERNYLVRMLAPPRPGSRGVFFTHEHETLSISYERRLREIDGRRRADPRITHDVTLEVDDFGNPRRVASVAYGRRFPDPSPLFAEADRARQGRLTVVLSEADYTEPVDTRAAYRNPLPAGSRKYQLYGVEPDAGQPGHTNLFLFQELAGKLARAAGHEIPFEDVEGRGAEPPRPARRLFQASRILYRSDDLRRVLPLGTLESLALPGANYTLAFTPGLVHAVYRRDGRPLLPEPERVFSDGGYVDLDGDGSWWMRSGRVFYSPEAGDDADAELAFARRHFFLRHRFEDAFGQSTTLRYDPHDLHHVWTRDSVGNTISATLDYRVLVPHLVTDTNGNRTAAAFDELGVVVGTATMGKEGESLGDSLDDFEPCLAERTIVEHLADPLRAPAALLGTAGSRVVYDLWAFYRTRGDPQPQPVVSWQIARETHGADLSAGQQSRLQHALGYIDGLGRGIQRKEQAQPTEEGEARWVGSGWRLLDNKGNAVRQYEAFFTPTPHFEVDARHGLSSTVIFDPLGRGIARLHPDHSYEKTVFDPWHVERWDVNDTSRTDPAADPEVGRSVRRLPDADYHPTWLEQRSGGGMGEGERRAAEQTARHAGTPTVTHTDPLGHTIMSIDVNRTGAGGDEFITTRADYDVEGQQRAVCDTFGRRVMQFDYNLMGTVVRQVSAEAGDRVMLSDVAGKGLRGWDARGVEVRYEYDPLRRPLSQAVIEEGGDPRVVEEIEYGEDQPEAMKLNLRGKTYRHRDTAGLSVNDAFDYKGNVLRNSRRFLRECDDTVDWAGRPELEEEVYLTRSAFDALSRPVAITTPDGSVTRPRYDPGNRMESVSVTLPGAAEESAIVRHIEYDARGQRTRIEYANGAWTSYRYDPVSLRLTRLETRRRTEGTVLQALRYIYDAVGNVLSVEDEAQQTSYFRNQVVSPDSRYTYDAVYRLVQAEGRELIGLAAERSPTDDDWPRVNEPLPADGQALRRYRESYAYDAVGNILELIHTAGDIRWRRRYQYEDGNNRLASTRVGELTVHYGYDASGSMTRMPHLPRLAWDFGNRLAQSTRQVTDDGDTTCYVYDGAGNRMRKVVKRGGQIVADRRYLGFYEPYREYGADGEVKLERDTLHVTDGQRRIAMVESGGGGEARMRYQLANQLESAVLELDEAAAIISYEEYYPYGSTSYQAARAGVEVSPKRYRYLGKELDNETGLYFHGSRYYASWLGRWISCDPSGLQGGANLYSYAYGCPTCVTDPNGRQPNPPQLFENWTYGDPVPDRAALGRNVQVDHPVQVSLRIQQRTAPGGMCYYDRGVSASFEEQGVLVETGKGLFHTELGKIQRQIKQNALAGTLQGEAELMSATRQAYSSTATLTGTTPNFTALDGAMLSQQNVLNVSTAETVTELTALPSGGTTLTATEEAMQMCFADTFQMTPEATNATLQATTSTLAADTVTAETAALVSTESKMVSAETKLIGTEAELLSSEAGLLSKTGSMMCKAAGPVLEVVGAYFALEAADKNFEEGDDVGGWLNVASAVPGVNVVAVPASMSWEYVKAGTAVINEQAQCGLLEASYMMGDVDPLDTSLDRCWFWLSDQTKRDIGNDRADQGFPF